MNTSKDSIFDDRTRKVAELVMKARKQSYINAIDCFLKYHTGIKEIDFDLIAVHDFALEHLQEQRKLIEDYE